MKILSWALVALISIQTSLPVYAAGTSFRILANTEILKTLSFDRPLPGVEGPSYVASNEQRLMAAIKTLKVPVDLVKLDETRQLAVDGATRVVYAELTQQLGIYSKSVLSLDPIVVKDGLFIGKLLVAYGSLKWSINNFRSTYAQVIASNPNLSSKLLQLEAIVNSFRTNIAKISSPSIASDQKQVLFDQISSSEKSLKDFMLFATLDNQGVVDTSRMAIAAALVMVAVVILVEIAAIVIPVVVIGIMDPGTGVEKLKAFDKQLEVQAAQVIRLN